MDPKAESFYSISPYVYCKNNPLLFTDLGGDSTRVYTETEGLYGHSWLSVGEGKNMTVYTYGKYGKKNDASIMKLSGTHAQAYLKTKEKTDFSTFVITDISDDKMSEVMSKVIDKAKAEHPKTFEKNDDESNVRVQGDEYYLLTNNCTTFVSDALINSGSKVLSNTNLIPDKRPNIRPAAPTALQGHLNYLSKQQNSVVYKTKK